jgi:ankyrin repeat protein
MEEWDYDRLTDLQKVLLCHPDYPPDHDRIADEVHRDPSLARWSFDGGHTLLHVAAHAGHLPLVRTLLAAGADANAGYDQGTPLHAAGGHTELLGLLLEAGADVNAQDCYGRNPLAWALLYHDAEAVRFLVARGAEALDDFSRTRLQAHRDHGLL